MDLHERLRALSSQLGDEVFSDADGFRAALDDYLDEGSASTGDINLLVDAVRLDAFRRMLTMIDNGAEPAAAVAMAGDQLALDRGSDDSRRSRWACAALGYAVGRVDIETVERQVSVIPGSTLTTPPEASTLPNEPGAPTNNPAAPPTVSPAPPTSPAFTPVVSPQITPAPDSRPRPPGIPPPHVSPGIDYGPATAHPRRRTGLAAIAAIGVLLLGGGAAAYAWSLMSDDSGGGEAASVPDDSVVLGLKQDEETSRLVTVDVTSSDPVPVPLTNGPADFLPSISPDRETVYYLRRSDDLPPQPMEVNLESRETSALFPDDSPCRYSDRPSWSPDGTLLAMVCEDPETNVKTLYALDTETDGLTPIEGAEAPTGTPTWISEEELVYIRDGGDDPSTLWLVGLDGAPAIQIAADLTGWLTHPDWSEERQQLLFSQHSSDEPFGEVCTTDPEENGEPSCNGEGIAHPVWSPDGSQIAYTLRNPQGVEELWISPLDSLDNRTLVPLPETPGPPVWASR